MTKSSVRARGCILLLATLLPLGAHAEDLTPPKLLSGAEALYPETARAQRLEGTVVLRLSLDSEGRVTDAEVLEPAGHGFDEAAGEAAARLQFEPARRAGVALPSRIRFPFVFSLPPEPVEAPTAPPVAPPPAVEVTVSGKTTDAQRLQRSAEAVNVVDTRKAKEQTADLGEALARTQGVAVRREGGLGSEARFSLNGLYDDQIRFFLDGVPLDLAGYPFGIASVPVNLVDRAEVYRGVVPIRFGADALGGAVNLVSDQTFQTHLGASYQVGSFSTHRATVDGRYRKLGSGLFAGGSAFFDASRNDYRVNVAVPDELGRLSEQQVTRFHDGYRAYGGAVELGLLDKPWARRASVQAFASAYDKQLQHNVVMTVPYGEATYGESVYGATARYEAPLSPAWQMELLASYARRTTQFRDLAESVYDWYGNAIRARHIAGEVSSRPSDQVVWQHGGFARALVSWHPTPHHALSLSLSPTLVTRQGDDRLQTDPTLRDPLAVRRDLLTFVSGVEHQLTLFEERLSNVLFLKTYVYRAASEELLPTGELRAKDRAVDRLGAGDAVRLQMTRWLFLKASYEYATRLPRPDEVFGDGVLTLANLELEPEVSHNANLGPRLELLRTPVGDVTVDVNAFWRESDQLIVLIGDDRFLRYQNVYRARGVGVENALSWASPGHRVGVDGMLTWQDVRNASDGGAFGGLVGDRIPNRPYLFASWGAHLRFAGLPGSDDTLEPFYSGRFVEAFFRGWESQGLRETKQVVPAQVTHSVGVTWSVAFGAGRATATLELDNVSDAKVYDFFGVQRPGRALFFKLTGELD